MEVRGYPSLKFFKDGRYYNFRGNRKLESLVEFIEEDKFKEADED